MASENKVSVEITLEEKAALKALTQLSREVQRTEKDFTRMGDEGDASIGIIGEATKGLSSGFRSLVGGVTVANLASEAIIGTGNAIKGFVLDSINAAIEAEESNQRLAQSLRATGSFSAEAMASFQAFAGQLAQTTIHGDDTIVSMVALAKSMGATNKQAQDMVRAAVELSATFGGSLEERVTQLGKTLTGTGGKLDSLVPGFKALTEEQLKSGEAFEFVNSKFSGAAAAQLDTYGGKLNQLKKSFGELQEAAGGLIVESGIADSFINGSKLIDVFVKSLAESRIESERAKGNFTETSESLKQLEGKYRDLWIEAQEAKKIINDPSFFDTLLARPVAAADNLKRLNAEMAATKALIDQATPQVEAAKSSATDGVVSGGISAEDQKRINSRKEADLLLQKAYIEQAAWEAEQDLLRREITAENQALELEQLIAIETEKLNARFAIEEQKAKLIEDSTTRNLTLEKIASEKSLAISQAEVASRKKIGDSMLKLEQQKQSAVVGLMSDAFSQAANVAKEGTALQFILQKAAALGNIYLADAQARAMIPAQTALIPYPANLAAIAQMEALVSAKTALGLAGVAASSIRFEHGGIVPGNSYSGDLITARVNSGEMWLNRQQQGNLFQMINSGGGGSGLEAKIDRLIAILASQPVIISVDGRALASVIRKEVQNGFRLAG